MAVWIPVNSFGMAFYKDATYVTGTQLAAAAVFSDYVSKHSGVFAEYGWYPVRRSSAEEFLRSEHEFATVLKTICPDPELMYTFDGNLSGKTIVDTMGYRNTILPILQGNGTNITTRVDELAMILSGLFG